MSNHVLLYITDRTAFPGDEPARRSRLLDKIAEAARCGVDLIQLREKDLSTHELESLARDAVNVIGQEKLATGRGPLTTALLINSRNDVAIAAGAEGVHLRSNDLTPDEVRTIWTRRAIVSPRENPPPSPLIAVSCHSSEEVAQAATNQADFAVFAPVFEKVAAPGTNPAGIETLRRACRAPIPVLALGGVSLQNAAQCLDAGAAGIAAIRLFQEHSIADVVRRLRSL